MPIHPVMLPLSARSAEILDEALRRIELSLPDQDLGLDEASGRLSLEPLQGSAVLPVDRWGRLFGSSRRWLSRSRFLNPERSVDVPDVA